MKPAPFDYERPATLADALRMMSEAADAKVLAGGQTLGPMLNLRLAQPALLIDISRITELAQVEKERGGVTLGATITHAAIEDGRVEEPTRGFLGRVAAGIGYRAVRTRGTVGGSLAHADPAADWLSCFTALGAELVLASTRSRRRAPLAGFVRGAMDTMLEPDELIAGIRLPEFSAQARFGYHKVCRKAGEFAEAIGVAVTDPKHDVHRLVTSTTAGAPLVIEDAEPFAIIPGISTLERRLIQAGFKGDAYETKLRAAVLQRALKAMAAT